MKKVEYGFSRRDFLVQGAATAGLLAASPVLGHGQTKSNVLHIIGHSHIDAAWLWPWRDGADSVLDTFRSALNRLNETPGFCYSHSSSAHYRWVQRADPAMFAQIQQRIREKRWEVVGGWPVEPDCNIPSTESFVRHSLYGKQYCRQALGVDVKIGMNPDSFGHAAGLPTILKNAGYGYYVFMRPQEHEMDLPLLFWWEGPDGSRVLTLRIWKSYDAWGSSDILANIVHSAATELFPPGQDHAAFFLGVGDHGGGVTKEQIRKIIEMRSDPSLPELRWSTLGAFFAEVEKSSWFASLPVVKGELQHHARGCYSAYGEGKFLNRRAERALGQAESISVAAGLAANHPYPGKEYAESWWKVTFCQFHDLMAGTALYSDYQESRDSIGYACETAQTSQVEALQNMAANVDLTKVKENALFLFNPLPWARKALAEVLLEASGSEKNPMYLESSDGQRIPTQWRPSPSMTNFFPRLSAWVDLPPCGYKVFELCHGEAQASAKIFNSVQVSQTGFGISSLKAQDGAELLSAPLTLVALSDTSDTWAHGVARFRQEMGRPAFISSTVIEDGPVTRVTRQRAQWMNSEIVLDIAQFAGQDFVELRFVIDWHEKEQILKLEIPTALAHPRIFAKVPGAIIERHTNGEEESYQDWAAVEGSIARNQYTLAVINNSTYSYDCLDGAFRTILIRSAPFARHDPNVVPHNDNNAWQDQGRQERTFWLIGSKGGYAGLALDRRAEEVQTPAEHVFDSAHPGKLPWQQSFLEVIPANIHVLALKRAEVNVGWIVIRVQERAGISTEASIKSAPLGLDTKLTLRPWELKTLLVKPAPGRKTEISEVSLIET